MKTSRREFMKFAASGLAIAGLPELLSSRSRETGALSSAKMQASYTPLSENERQRIISQAHFGRE